MTKNFLGYGRQSIDETDIAAVIEALNCDFLTQGPTVEAFEVELARTVGARHAIAVSNGTAALHLACLAAGLAPGHQALVPTLTFVATANAPLYCGARTDLLDIDPVTLGFDPASVSAATSGNENLKAVLPVFFGGLAAQAEGLQEASDGAIIIADACHALGGHHEDGSPVGSCKHYDMAAFSFHPVKPITTGEGGAITTNDDSLARRIRILRNHGIERTPENYVANRKEALGPWYYEQQFLGFNYRMTDIQAALGLSQLKRLKNMTARRREIATYYDGRFAALDTVHVPQAAAEDRARSALHLYILMIDFNRIGRSRKDIMAALGERQIGTQVHYIPVHRQPFHNSSDRWTIDDFPHAENYYHRAISIPMFSTMTDAEAEYVADQICGLLR